MVDPLGQICVPFVIFIKKKKEVGGSSNFPPATDISF